MAIEGAAIAKGVLAAAIVGGLGAGAYFVYGRANLQEQTHQQDSTPQDTSKYDEALLTFLDGESNDIVFEVKDGIDANTDISVSNLKIANGQNQNKKLTVRVKIPVPAANATNNSFMTNGSSTSASSEDLQKVREANSSSNWEWSCDLVFTKGSDVTAENFKSEVKGKMMGENKGLFALLKKDFSQYTGNGANKWTKADAKNEKKEFIRQCAKKRASRNKTVTASNLDVKGGTFEFQQETSGTNLELKAESAPEFNKWFKDEHSSKEFPATA